MAAGPHTFQLRRVAALEGALAAKGGALEAGERGGIDVVLVRDAAVYWLARHLFVPLALRAGHRYAGSCLEDGGGHCEMRQADTVRCLRQKPTHGENPSPLGYSTRRSMLDI